MFLRGGHLFADFRSLWKVLNLTPMKREGWLCTVWPSLPIQRAFLCSVSTSFSI